MEYDPYMGAAADSVVVAKVVVVSVPVIFTIIVVVFLVVGDEIFEGETVVGCDKVDAAVRLSRMVKITGTGQACS